MSRQMTRLRLSDDVFRQYDIRGKVNSELPINELYELTSAIAYYWKEKHPGAACIAVGADGRTHSPAITDEVCRALQESGLDVLFIGVCPTPVLYFAMHTLPVDAGLMITASHNPKEYNGLKIMLGKNSVWGQELQTIKAYYMSGKRIKTSKNGSYAEHIMVPSYSTWLAEHFSLLKNMQLKVVVDCGNGTAGMVLPQLCTLMGWSQVKLLYPEVDGTYPHHTADPAVEENMRDVQDLLQKSDYQIGIGLDGDCDRMAAVTKSGDLILGDKLLAIFAQDIRASFPNAVIVHDLKCSSGLKELLQQWGLESHATPTGHAWVKQYMHKYNALLGGELSCHLFFKDRYFGFDDGIYAMMRLFEVILKTGTSLDQLVATFPHKISSPEIRFEYPEGTRDTIISHVQNYFEDKKLPIRTIDGVYITFQKGWGIIRVSNTQPVLSIRFEADTQKEFEMIREIFIEALEGFYELSFLQKMIAA